MGKVTEGCRCEGEDELTGEGECDGKLNRSLV